MLFKNFKEAVDYYKFKGSHRYGTLGDTNGVIRSYSNGKNGDIFYTDKIYYKIKNERVRKLFRLSIGSQKPLRFFVKTSKGVEDKGLYRAEKFYKNYVKLIK